MERNPARCPAPHNFRPAGNVKHPKLELTEPQFRKMRKTNVQLAGLSYERRAQKYLQAAFPHHYIAGPWFSFCRGDSLQRDWCQPDGLLIDIVAGLITLIEIKLRHTSDAWWQTRHLYLPVISAFFGTEMWKFNILEIVRWYDPDTQFPERYHLVPQVGILQPDKFGVHIWKPRKEEKK